MSKTIRIPITNTLLGGDYSGLIHVGSGKTPANVLLDTGSSSLALDANRYDPTKDTSASVTDIVQEVGYGDGSRWIGSVVQTSISLGQGAQALLLPRVYAAVAYRETPNIFNQADGILGLAYTGLNDAYTLTKKTVPPTYNPNDIQSGVKTYLKPYFTQLEESGVVANKFAFYTLRSTVSIATPNPATDPLNNGFLILGGGEESTDLYTGQFQSARVVADEYYNTNLKAIIVGNSAPINISPPTRKSGEYSNSIVDSGTQPLALEKSLFHTVMGRFSTLDQKLARAARTRYVPVTSLKFSDWPTLTFVLEGDAGADVRLTVAPDTYWQVNTHESGYAQLMLDSFPQTILGLPFMNNYFTVFDRSVNSGLGVVKFAAIKRP